MFCLLICRFCVLICRFNVISNWLIRNYCQELFVQEKTHFKCRMYWCTFKCLQTIRKMFPQNNTSKPFPKSFHTSLSKTPAKILTWLKNRKQDTFECLRKLKNKSIFFTFQLKCVIDNSLIFLYCLWNSSNVNSNFNPIFSEIKYYCNNSWRSVGCAGVRKWRKNRKNETSVASICYNFLRHCKKRMCYIKVNCINVRFYGTTYLLVFLLWVN